MSDHKIIVKHSCIIINDYELHDCEKLERMFSIWDPVYFTERPLAYYYDEKNKRLYLPRGIDVGYIENTFGEHAYLDTHYDDYAYTNNPILIKYMPRDDVQAEALRFLLGKSEYSAMTRKSQQSLNLTTGKGKTYCSIAAISCCCIKSAVITYSISWIEQWKNCFLEYTDMKLRQIKIVNSSAIINKFINHPETADQYDIFLFTHSTIKSYGDKNGWESIHKLFKILKIGMKFYDEAHLNFKNMAMIDFFTNVYKTYYISASPARSSEDENRIYKLYMKNVPAIDLFDQESDPHTSYISMRYSSNPTPQQVSSCKNKYGLSAVAYADYVVNQPNFLKMIDIILDMAFKLKGKTLIYMATNSSIEKLYNWIINRYPELYYDIGIYTSIIDSSKKEENLNKKIILSTIASCGAAMDIKGLSMTVIAASPFKSEVMMQQVLGRTRDKNTFCIEFMDLSFNKIVRYYYNKKKIIEKYALDLSDTRFSNDELDYRVSEIFRKRYLESLKVCKLNDYSKFKVVNIYPKGYKFKVVTMNKPLE